MSDIRCMKPSEILYSIPCINNRNNEYGYIGERLDKYYDGRLDVNSIPRLQVFHQQDKWIVSTTESMNQQLWILQHLERLNKCHRITVEVIQAPDVTVSVPASTTVDVNGGPRGQWHKQSPHKPLHLHVQNVSQFVG